MPAVRIISVDNNVVGTQALHVLHRHHNDDHVWVVFDALAHGRGGHVEASGATERVLPLPAGKSLRDPAMRKDHHAAVTV